METMPWELPDAVHPILGAYLQHGQMLMLDSSDSVVAAPAAPFLDSIATTETTNLSAYGFTWEQLQSLNEIPVPEGVQPLGDRVFNCSQNFIVKYQKAHCTNFYTPLFHRCNQKFCPPCSIRRSERLIEQFTPLVQSFKRPKMMTLTYKNTAVLDDETRAKYDKNRSAMKKWLQRHYPIKKGIIATEVTHHSVGDDIIDKRTRAIKGQYTEKNAGFHYHLHILYDGPFIPYEELRKHWTKVTKDSSIVDIRDMRGKPDKGLGYIIKYVTKGDHIKNFDALKQYITVMQHRRMIQTFGTAMPKKQKYDFFCKTCDAPVSHSTLRKNIVSSAPSGYTISPVYPYYVVRRAVAKEQPPPVYETWTFTPPKPSMIQQTLGEHYDQ